MNSVCTSTEALDEEEVVETVELSGPSELPPGERGRTTCWLKGVEDGLRLSRRRLARIDYLEKRSKLK